MTGSLFPAHKRFWKGNLHTHSTLSDGALLPEEVCRKYREAGYDFLALTDHFQARYNYPVADTRAFRTATFTTIAGAEVHAPATLLGHQWHILAVGLPYDFAPNYKDETGPQLARRCADAGAYVAIAHPAWYGLTEIDAATIPSAHAVEVYNHTSHIWTDRGDGWYLLDRLCNDGHTLNACATDDAHFHTDDAFGGWVMVSAEANDPALLVEALKAGHYYSSQGPIIHDIVIEGSFVNITCSKAKAIMLLGRGSCSNPWLEPGQTQARLSLKPFEKSGWFRVTVIDDAGKRAWSNPVALPLTTGQ